MNWLYVISLVSIVFDLWAVFHVRRDYNSRQTLRSFTVVIVWMAYLCHSFLVIWAAVLQLWRLPIGRLQALITGIVVTLIGVILLAMGIFTFRSIERMSGQKTDELIDSGIYAWSRNPQNVGWGFALLGIAVAGRSGYGLLLVVLFALVIHVYTVKLEEPYLEEVYGEAYRRYRSRTNRYFNFPG